MSDEYSVARDRYLTNYSERIMLRFPIKLFVISILYFYTGCYSKESPSDNSHSTDEIKVVETKVQRIFSLVHYQHELFILGMIIAYFLVFIVGYCRCTKMMQEISKAILPAFSSEFKITEQGTESDSHLTMINTQWNSSYTWLPGYSKIKGVLWEIDMFPSHDLIQNLIIHDSENLQQRMKLTAYVDRKLDESFILILSQKNLVKTNKNLSNLISICTNVPRLPPFLSANFILHSESAECTTRILNDGMQQAIRRFGESFQYLTICDLSHEKLDISNPPNNNNNSEDSNGHNVIDPFLLSHRTKVTMCFRFDDESIAAAKRLVQEYVEMLSRLSTLVLGKEGKRLVNDREARIQLIMSKLSHQTRQEMAMKAKDLKVKSERERMENETDPEKQKQLKLQEEKREAKLAKRKMKMKRFAVTT